MAEGLGALIKLVEGEIGVIPARILLYIVAIAILIFTLWLIVDKGLKTLRLVRPFLSPVAEFLRNNKVRPTQEIKENIADSLTALQKEGNILSLEKREPKNMPPVWVNIILTVCAGFFLLFFVFQINLVISGVLEFQINWEWIIFYLIFGVLPLWLLTDLYFDFRRSKTGKSAVAVESTITIRGNIEDIYIMCIKAINNMKFEIKTATSPTSIRAYSKKAKIIVVLQQLDDAVSINTICDSIWVTVKFGEKNYEKMADGFQTEFFNLFSTAKNVQPIDTISETIETNLETLTEYLAKWFPDHFYQDTSFILEFLEELKKSGYDTINQIDEVLRKSSRAFTLFQENQIKDGGNAPSQIGAARISLQIYNCNFYRTRGEMSTHKPKLDWKSEWMEKYKDYHILIEGEPISCQS